MRRLFIFLLTSFIAFAPSLGDISPDVFLNSRVDLREFFKLAQEFKEEYSHSPRNMSAYNSDQLDAIRRMLGDNWTEKIDENVVDPTDGQLLVLFGGKEQHDRAPLLEWGIRHQAERIRSIARDAIGLDEDLSSMALENLGEEVGEGSESPARLISRRLIEKQRSSRMASLSDKDFAAGYILPDKFKDFPKRPDWRSMGYEEGLDWSSEDDGSEAEEAVSKFIEEFEDGKGVEDVANLSDEDDQEEIVDFARAVAEQGWEQPELFDLDDDDLVKQEEEPSDSGELNEFVKLMLEDRAKEQS